MAKLKKLRVEAKEVLKQPSSFPSIIARYEWLNTLTYEEIFSHAWATFNKGTRGTYMCAGAKTLLAKDELKSFIVNAYFHYLNGSSVTDVVRKMRHFLREEALHRWRIPLEDKYGKLDDHLWEQYDAIPFDGITKDYLILIFEGYRPNEAAAFLEISNKEHKKMRRMLVNYVMDNDICASTTRLLKGLLETKQETNTEK